MKNPNGWLAVAAAASLLLSACGGSDPTPVNGTFVDAPVQGLGYRTATGTGTTSASGGYDCVQGDNIAFTVGALALGSGACATMVTPMTLAGSSDVKSDRVVNRLLAIQLLDDDSDPANGIRITPAVSTALAGRTMDFNASASTFDAAMTATLALLPEPYKNRSVDTDRRTLVREHFEDSLNWRAGTPVAETSTQSSAAGTVTATVTRYQIQAADSFFVPYEGNNSATAAEFPKGFLPSYGSGLAFKSKRADGTLEFYGITDRGPNGDGPKVPAPAPATGTSDAKYFPSPSFAPAIGLLTVGTDGAVLRSSTPLRVSSTAKASGMSIAPGQVGSSAEVPLMNESRYDPSKADYSPNGMDTESVVVDNARNALWVSDEYGPFILKLDPATGVILKKYQPGAGAADLPAVLAKRRANRGMEGLALDVATGKLHGFLQSPLDDGKASFVKPGASAAANENVRDFAKFARWVMFDPATETTRLYAYPINGSLYSKDRTGNAKLGDMVSLGNGKFIVIEQGARKSDGKVQNWLMLVELPADATDITAVGSELEKNSMDPTVTSAIAYSAVVPLKTTRLLDLNAAGWLAEKAEGLALVDETTLALTNDNDFGMTTYVLDAAGKPIAGADVTACTADAAGAFTGTGDCAPGNKARPGRGVDTERPSRLWLLKFGRKLSEYSVP